MSPSTSIVDVNFSLYSKYIRLWFIIVTSLKMYQLIHESEQKFIDNTIIIPFVFDKSPKIGPIQKGNLFFACVSANELNPTEGTECEHRDIIHRTHT